MKLFFQIIIVFLFFQNYLFSENLFNMDRVDFANKMEIEYNKQFPKQMDKYSTQISANSDEGNLKFFVKFNSKLFLEKTNSKNIMEYKYNIYKVYKKRLPEMVCYSPLLKMYMNKGMYFNYVFITEYDLYIIEVPISIKDCEGIL